MSNETRGVWLIVLTLVGLLVLSTGLGIELKELAGRLSDCEAAVGKLAAQYNRIQALLGPPKLITAEDDDAIEKFLEPILTAPPPAAPEPHDWGPELSIADMRDEIAAEERARDARTEWEKSMSRLATQPDTSVVITTDDVFSPPTDFERGHDAGFREALGVFGRNNKLPRCHPRRLDDNTTHDAAGRGEVTDVYKRKSADTGRITTCHAANDCRY